MSLTILGSFLLVYTLSAEDSDPRTPEDLGPSATTVEQERDLGVEDARKPRLSRELMGLFITGSEADVPDDLRRDCAITEEVADDQAGAFDLDVQLPEAFEIHDDSVNTGVIACDGRVVSARWEYEYPQANPGHLIVIRSDTKYILADVSTDRVEPTEIAGREAIVLRPIRENGMAPDSHGIIHTNAFVIFPEDFGATYLMSVGVPFEQVLAVADIVGRATR